MVRLFWNLWWGQSEVPDLSCKNFGSLGPPGDELQAFKQKCSPLIFMFIHTWFHKKWAVGPKNGPIILKLLVGWVRGPRFIVQKLWVPGTTRWRVTGPQTKVFYVELYIADPHYRQCDRIPIPIPIRSAYLVIKKIKKTTRCNSLPRFFQNRED